MAPEAHPRRATEHQQHLVKKPKLEYVRAQVFKKRLWEKMDAVIKLLRPISRALGELESDNGILSTT
jgi:hypothetical protein